MLTNPLRDRFGIVSRLEFYSPAELTQIVEAFGAPARCGHRRRRSTRNRCALAWTPRIANRLLRRVRDFAEVKAQGKVTKDVADAALKMLDVDPDRSDVMDRKLLLAVLEKFGRRTGRHRKTWRRRSAEERDTIEDVLEPFLIQQGYLQRTPRGGAWPPC